MKNSHLSPNIKPLLWLFAFLGAGLLFAISLNMSAAIEGFDFNKAETWPVLLEGLFAGIQRIFIAGIAYFFFEVGRSALGHVHRYFRPVAILGTAVFVGSLTLAGDSGTTNISGWSAVQEDDWPESTNDESTEPPLVHFVATTIFALVFMGVGASRIEDYSDDSEPTTQFLGATVNTLSAGDNLTTSQSTFHSIGWYFTRGVWSVITIPIFLVLLGLLVGSVPFAIVQSLAIVKVSYAIYGTIGLAVSLFLGLPITLLPPLLCMVAIMASPSVYRDVGLTYARRMVKSGFIVLACVGFALAASAIATNVITNIADKDPCLALEYGVTGSVPCDSLEQSISGAPPQRMTLEQFHRTDGHEPVPVQAAPVVPPAPVAIGKRVPLSQLTPRPQAQEQLLEPLPVAPQPTPQVAIGQRVPTSQVKPQAATAPAPTPPRPAGGRPATNPIPVTQAPPAPVDIEKIQLDAQRGNPLAQAMLAQLYSEGNGVPQDKAEAAKWLRKAAEQGLADAQVLLGFCLKHGDGVQADTTEATNWFRKAAEQGSPLGQMSLANQYRGGEGVPQDFAEAVKWYRKAAEQGDADAQQVMGRAYRLGEGVAQDSVEAAMWYRKAAEQGLAGAQVFLGVMHSLGEGVPQDDAEAANWFRKAAEQGDSQGQDSLGSAYFLGLGVPQDFVLAHMWANLAAAKGHDLAIETRDKVAGYMTPEQIAEAQRLAREWRAGHRD